MWQDAEANSDAGANAVPRDQHVMRKGALVICSKRDPHAKAVLRNSSTRDADWRTGQPPP